MDIRTIAGLALAAAVLTGCQQMQDNPKQTGGTVIGAGIGAGLGALIGSQFGSSAGQIAATAIGTLAGAWIGSEIGSYLDEEDRQEMAAATQQAVVTGEAQDWQNPDTGVSGSAQVVGSETTERQVSMPVMKDRVQQVPPLDLIGEPYQANSGINVRGGPGTNYVVVDKLGSGQTVQVVGQVQGQPWYMISQNGAGSGFVYSKLLMPAKGAVAPRAASVVATPVDEKSISVNRTCRTIKQTVKLSDGKERKEDVTACQTPNGWEIV